MTNIVHALQDPSWGRDITNIPMGLIQELRFDPSRKKTTYNGSPLTASQFLEEFNISSLAYAGQTLQTDDEIRSTGPKVPFHPPSLLLIDKYSYVYMVEKKLGLSDHEKQLSTFCFLSTSSHHRT